MINESDKLIDSINSRAEKRKAGLAESSVVIPINKAFEASQKVIPSEQALNILSNAKIIARKACGCRSKSNGCDASMDVCIVLDSLAEKRINEGIAEVISIDEAKQILNETEEAGLIHLIINMTGWQPEAICSCCRCCCHELKALLEFGYLDAVLQSDYIIEKDEEKCINCGECIAKCHFKAHTNQDEKVIFISEKCYGCGLCVTICQNQALTLIQKISTNFDS